MDRRELLQGLVGGVALLTSVGRPPASPAPLPSPLAGEGSLPAPPPKLCRVANLGEAVAADPRSWSLRLDHAYLRLPDRTWAAAQLYAAGPSGRWAGCATFHWAGTLVQSLGWQLNRRHGGDLELLVVDADGPAFARLVLALGQEIPPDHPTVYPVPTGLCTHLVIAPVRELRYSGDDWAAAAAVRAAPPPELTGAQQLLLRMNPPRGPTDAPAHASD